MIPVKLFQRGWVACILLTSALSTEAKCVTCPAQDMSYACPWSTVEGGKPVKMVAKYIPEDSDFRVPDMVTTDCNLLCVMPACISSPCHNGGTCQEVLTGFTCKCPPTYLGERCQQQKESCSSSPCKHRSKCEDFPTGYRCKCRSNFGGRRCENKLPTCSDEACQNEGECKYVSTFGPLCSCKYETCTHGKFCEIRSPSNNSTITKGRRTVHIGYGSEYNIVLELKPSAGFFCNAHFANKIWNVRSPVGTTLAILIYHFESNETMESFLLVFEGSEEPSALRSAVNGKFETLIEFSDHFGIHLYGIPGKDSIQIGQRQIQGGSLIKGLAGYSLHKNLGFTSTNSVWFLMYVPWDQHEYVLMEATIRSRY